jgi:hypothetical protein
LTSSTIPVALHRVGKVLQSLADCFARLRLFVIAGTCKEGFERLVYLCGDIGESLEQPRASHDPRRL